MTRVVWVVLRAPRLWPTAARVARSTVPRGWWRRRPFLPVPTRRYVEFRLATQYGGDLTSRDDLGADAVAYLEWCRDWHRSQPSH